MFRQKLIPVYIRELYKPKNDGMKPDAQSFSATFDIGYAYTTVQWFNVTLILYIIIEVRARMYK
mgnify:CR=1 FL=1